MSGMDFSGQEGDSELDKSPVDYSLISLSHTPPYFYSSSCFLTLSTLLAVPFLSPCQNED